MRSLSPGLTRAKVDTSRDPVGEFCGSERLAISRPSSVFSPTRMTPSCRPTACGRDRLVAGDHDRPDPRSTKAIDRSLHVGRWWVHQADEADESEILG